MKKYETYWDNFNVELYALIKQVKKNKNLKWKS
jgi:hypothetical protein